MSITVKQARAICCKATGLKVKDTSGFNWFGYDFAVIDRETGQQLLKSFTYWNDDGKFAPRFNEEQLRVLLPNFQGRIDKVLSGKRVY